MRRQDAQPQPLPPALSILSAFSPYTGRQGDQGWLDRTLGELAALQFGVLAWFQLAALGVPRGRVDRFLQSGRLHPLYRGVYALGHPVLTVEGRRLAATLALGPAAALSHRPGAAHWGMLQSAGAFHVTVPGRGARRRRQGIVVHRVPEVATTVHVGIPVTTVAWTLLDLAATAPRRVLGQALAGAERCGILDVEECRPLIASRRAGAVALREELELYDGAPTWSELERLFLALLRAHRLPRPRVNAEVEGFVVDFHWPEHRLIVETDGRDHDLSAGRRTDGARDAAHALAGWRTQRISWWQVVHEPDRTAELVRTLLHEQAVLLGRR